MSRDPNLKSCLWLASLDHHPHKRRRCCHFARLQLLFGDFGNQLNSWLHFRSSIDRLIINVIKCPNCHNCSSWKSGGTRWIGDQLWYLVITEVDKAMFYLFFSAQIVFYLFCPNCVLPFQPKLCFTFSAQAVFTFSALIVFYLFSWALLLPAQPFRSLLLCSHLRKRNRDKAMQWNKRHGRAVVL